MGIQNDEALFAAGIYPPFAEDAPKVFGKPYPEMVMSYVGSVKSFLYAPIFRVWRPSAASVRIPALVLGGLTVWLFYRFVKRALDTRTALIATALVATDTSFLLTTRWDWGPVVLQHLCLVTGVLAVLRFSQDRRLGWLFAGFLAFGLGVWDKAIFSWSIVGLGVAVLAVFPRRTLALLSFRTVAVAALGGVIGSAPFIHYNVTHDFVTFRQNAAWSSDILPYKAHLLLATLNGEALFAGVARDEWEQPIREPDDSLKKGFVSVSLALGSPRRNWQPYLLGLVILLLPFVWRSPARSAFLFSAIYFSVTWAQMAFTKNAGTGLHHPILMWPIPVLGMAAVLSQASRRFGRIGTPLLAGVVGVVCFVNLALTSTYYTNMLRNGGNRAWSDAIYSVSQALPEIRPSFVCALDWGFYEPIRLLHRGRIPTCVAAEPEREPEYARLQLADPDIVYITHRKEIEFEPGRQERLMTFARQAGYSKSYERVFSDYNGRPVIEVFKLHKP